MTLLTKLFLLEFIQTHKVELILNFLGRASKDPLSTEAAVVVDKCSQFLTLLFITKYVECVPATCTTEFISNWFSLIYPVCICYQVFRFRSSYSKRKVTIIFSNFCLPIPLNNIFQRKNWSRLVKKAGLDESADANYIREINDAKANQQHLDIEFVFLLCSPVHTGTDYVTWLFICFKINYRNLSQMWICSAQ